MLQEVIEVEAELRDNRIALEQCEYRLETTDRDDPERMKYVKKVTTFKLLLARQEADLAVLKAKAGIVGQTWYNKDT